MKNGSHGLVTAIFLNLCNATRQKLLYGVAVASAVF